MVRTALPVALLVAAALLAATNPLWLFPNEGEMQYTYERSELRVENDTLVYDGDAGHEYGFANDLAGVDCEAYDDPGRVCAFDRYLAAEGPVTVAGDEQYPGTPDFTLVDGDLYRRLTYGTPPVTYDVQRVTPREYLRTAASNVTVTREELPAVASPQRRAVVTGEPQTSLEYRDDEAGRVWYRDGTYYTVVVTDQSPLDRPLVSAPLRRLLSLAGLAILLVIVPLRTAGHLSPLREYM